ncbi:aminoglycoside phosphotransferase family protein [Rhizobium sp. CB3090]|uniref:aminoglycoside phosphotransferase family protein n=1 Tax=Rhizobium sp. CB3090 TaxID=3039156 RepID=UPI0024B17357|nr:aminoglycoside phosphotransferase family protein [Rhizobium sp. CB3090]WFU11008.1 aminoglycoside phosphotransferase family protein [Rhizobium sp. CB3090]
MIGMERGNLLGTGKEAEVYESGELVLKLYKAPSSKASAFREAAILAILGDLGVNAPRVQEVGEIEGRWGLTMTRAEGGTFGEAIALQPLKTPAYLDALAAMHRKIHEHSGVRLPSLKSRLSHNIERAGQLREIQRQHLLSGLRRLPEGGRLCHGDFHPWNVLGFLERAVTVDWLDACSGDPFADVCRSYVLMHHYDRGLAAAYVDAYAGINGRSRAAVLAWLPYVAAARLAEDVPDEVEGLMGIVEGSTLS